MVFEFTSEIQPFQSRCVKSRKQHIKDDQNIYRHILLKVFHYLFAGFFVVAIVQNKTYFEIAFQAIMSVQFVLNVGEILI